MCTPYIENQKWLPWQHPLEPRNRLCRHQIAWPRKPTPRIKQRVASYHTSEVIAHPKAKRGCHGNVPQHLWTPIQRMIPMAHPSPQPKRHPYRSAVFAQTTVEWDAHSNQKFLPSHGGSGPPSNTWFPGPTQVLNPKGSSIGAAVFAGLTSVTDRQTTLLGR